MLTLTLAVGSVQFPAMEAKAAGLSGEAKEILDGLTAPSVSGSDEEIYMPDTPNGVSVRFCADYEQIVGEDGTIYTPLTDKEVKGFYEVTQGDTSDKTNEFTFTVPGIYSNMGTNEKPAVIPELQEWYGKTGKFVVSASSRIIADGGALLDVAEKFARDYKDVTGLDIPVITGTKADTRIGDFYLALSAEEEGLGKEGYIIDIDDVAAISAEQSVGAYWATRTVLQILKQTSGSMPKGTVRDYPKYEVRAFSLDVGRKPFSLDALYQFAENMAWYKMNSFQVHLSDNLIFMEDYSSLEEAKEQTYAGFRLESGVLNTEGKSATSEDMFYTKDEFRTFIQDCRIMGVGIVPEFDMPAHALPFTRAFPEYRTKRETGGSHAYLIDELDLSNPETTEFAKSLWSDCFEGDEPVFDEETVIHIGTDEYHGTAGQEGNEMFRKFSADMINFVQGTGRTVRMWGSLSNKSGTTEVPVKDVQLNVWNTSYSNPKTMYDLGYDMINTLDGSLYMVPSGTGSRGGYGDYLNTQNLYNNWQPNNFSTYTLPASSDQMLGACFAVWHDNIDTRANGISQYDSFDRFFDALPVMSAKLWGDAADRNYSDFIKVIKNTGAAPGTTILGEVDYATSKIADYTFDKTLTEDSSINGFDLVNAVNARQVASSGGKAVQLNGGESYLETPGQLNQIGSNAVLTMKVKMDEGANPESEQILCESKDVFGTYGTYSFKAAVKQTGNVGFSREGYDYSFDYELPKGQWVELSFHSGKDEVALYVDGELVDNAPDFYYANHPDTEMSVKKGNAMVATMLVPFGRIGSETDSFQGQIESVTVTGEKKASAEPGAIPHSEMTVTACSEATETASEGPARYAIDDNDGTFWHTNWSSDITISEEEPHWLEVTLANPKVINKLTYLPRQDSANGRIFQYSIVVTKPDGTPQTVVDKGRWENDSSRKTAEFSEIEAKTVKLVVYDAQENEVGAHATIAELNLFEPTVFGAAELKAELDKYAGYDKNIYTSVSWNALMDACKAAQNVLDYKESTRDDYIYAYEQLQKAAANLAEKPVRNQLLDTSLDVEELLKNTANYTPESVRALQAALQAAKKALKNPDLTEKEIQEVLKTLQETKLVEKPATPTPPPTPGPGPDDGKKPDPVTPAPVVPGVGAAKVSGGVTYKVTKSNAANGTVTAFKLKDNKKSKITIPSTVTIDGVSFKVTAISQKAFQNAKELKTVVIGANVTSIGSKAFYNCKKLKNITFKSVKASKINSKAFKGIVANSKITVPKKMAAKQINKLKTSLKKAGIGKKATYKKK